MRNIISYRHHCSETQVLLVAREHFFTSSLASYWKKPWLTELTLLFYLKKGGGWRGERGEWFLLVIAWLSHIRSLQVLSPALVNLLRKKLVSLSFRQDSQKENKQTRKHKQQQKSTAVSIEVSSREWLPEWSSWSISHQKAGLFLI